MTKTSIPTLAQEIEYQRNLAQCYKEEARMWEQIASGWKRSTQITTICLWLLVTLQWIMILRRVI